jgi:hypothetical protein
MDIAKKKVSTDGAHGTDHASRRACSQFMMGQDIKRRLIYSGTGAFQREIWL